MKAILIIAHHCILPGAYKGFEEIMDKLKSMKFADIKGQGYMPTYIRDKLTDALHKVCGFRTDYEFITKADMRTIEKQSKQR